MAHLDSPGLPGHSDFLVIGGGVVGLTVALELRRRHPGAVVTLIEKERACGLHASGRNSGVLHGGFYYTADSLKARLTREGNREMTRYCMERSLAINRCGKLVVATDESELPALEELHRRAAANGVELHRLSAREATAIEPQVRPGAGRAFSPTTATVDPGKVMAALTVDAQRSGVKVVAGCPFLGRNGQRVQTGHGTVECGYVVNAAGLYADRIAKAFGHGRHFALVPFKGLYLYAEPHVPALRTNIYPVPDLRNPFLGVHFTATASGRAKIGPTAVPCLWREHYRGIENFRWGEANEIIRREFALWRANAFDFRRLAWEELLKQFRPRMVALAGRLVHGVASRDFLQWGVPGIRAQLVDLRKAALEMDFRYEGDQHSFHILNAVSPAFTCAFPFSRLVCDEIEARLSSRPDRGGPEGAPGAPNR